VIWPARLSPRALPLKVGGVRVGCGLYRLIGYWTSVQEDLQLLRGDGHHFSPGVKKPALGGRFKINFHKRMERLTASE